MESDDKNKSVPPKKNSLPFFSPRGLLLRNSRQQRKDNSTASYMIPTRSLQHLRKPSSIPITRGPVFRPLWLPHKLRPIGNGSSLISNIRSKVHENPSHIPFNFGLPCSSRSVNTESKKKAVSINGSTYVPVSQLSPPKHANSEQSEPATKTSTNFSKEKAANKIGESERSSSITTSPNGQPESSDDNASKTGIGQNSDAFVALDDVDNEASTVIQKDNVTSQKSVFPKRNLHRNAWNNFFNTGIFGPRHRDLSKKGDTSSSNNGQRAFENCSKQNQSVATASFVEENDVNLHCKKDAATNPKSDIPLINVPPKDDNIIDLTGECLDNPNPPTQATVPLTWAPSVIVPNPHHSNNESLPLQHYFPNAEALTTMVDKFNALFPALDDAWRFYIETFNQYMNLFCNSHSSNVPQIEDKTHFMASPFPFDVSVAAASELGYQINPVTSWIPSTYSDLNNIQQQPFPRLTPQLPDNLLLPLEYPVTSTAAPNYLPHETPSNYCFHDFYDKQH